MPSPAEIATPASPILTAPPQVLLGRVPSVARALAPFDGRVIALLSALSARLRTAPETRALTDVQTFAFWCRQANLRRLAAAHDDGRARLGLGLLFHVAPGNVPINFAFSLAFGLLAGNANIVRVPSRPLPQVDVVRDALAALLDEADHTALAEMIALVRYPADGAFTAEMSSRADGRIIWGGDQTVNKIRALPSPPRARDVTFADRYSFCVMEARAVMDADEATLARLAEGFYNDTYLMDQNACSSPHLVVWRGTTESAEQARLRFWNRLQPLVAAHYPLSAVHAVDKYTQLLATMATDDGLVGTIGRWRNDIHTVGFKRLPPVLDTLRGCFGLFHEYHTTDLQDLAPLIGGRFQTLTYFGLAGAELKDFVVGNRLPGIDRIVPVGRALDMDVIWDGYDLIATLSRIIDVRSSGHPPSA